MKRSDVLRHCETMCSLACPNRVDQPCVEEFLLFLSPSDSYRFCTSLCREEFVVNSMPKCCQSETCTNTFCVFCHDGGVYVSDSEEDVDDKDDEDEEEEEVGEGKGRSSVSLLKFMFYLPCENAANSENGPKLIYNCLYFHCSKVCDVVMGYSLKRAFQAKREEGGEEEGGEDGKEKQSHGIQARAQTHAPPLAPLSSTTSTSTTSTSTTALAKWSRKCTYCDICGYIEASASFVRMHNGKERTLNCCGSSCLHSEFQRMQTKQQLQCIRCRQPMSKEYCVLRRAGIVRCSCTDCFETNRICHVCGKATQLFACGQCRTTRYCSKECQKCDWAEHKETCLQQPSVNKEEDQVATRKRVKDAKRTEKEKTRLEEREKAPRTTEKEPISRAKQTDPLEVD